MYKVCPEGKDSIRVYVEDEGPSRGRITIQCYASAWTGYWGNHGEESLERFFVGSHTDYLVNNLMWGVSAQLLKVERVRMEATLAEIVESIKAYFMKEVFPVGNAIESV